jgi:hypothetical protein
MTEMATPTYEKRRLLLEALQNICGEANEAALLAMEVIEPGESLRVFRREVARIMEIVDMKLVPALNRSALELPPKIDGQA